MKQVTGMGLAVGFVMAESWEGKKETWAEVKRGLKDVKHAETAAGSPGARSRAEANKGRRHPRTL